MQHYIQANFSTAMFKSNINSIFMYRALSKEAKKRVSLSVLCVRVCVKPHLCVPHGLVELDLGSVLLH